MAIVAQQNLSAEARSHVVAILGSDDLASIASGWTRCEAPTSTRARSAPIPRRSSSTPSSQRTENGTTSTCPSELRPTRSTAPSPTPTTWSTCSRRPSASLRGAATGGSRSARPSACSSTSWATSTSHCTSQTGTSRPGRTDRPSSSRTRRPLKGVPNDKGGNADFFGPGRFDELHAYWDTALVEKIGAGKDPAALAAMLEKRVADGVRELEEHRRLPPLGRGLGHGEPGGRAHRIFRHNLRRPDTRPAGWD